MAELKLTDVFPNSSQTETELILKKTDLHSSLTPDADNSLDSLLASLTVGAASNDLLSLESQETFSDRSVAIYLDGESLEEGNSGEKMIVWEYVVRLRQPVDLPEFNAADY